MFLVVPYKKYVILYMALHKVLPVSFQWMRIIFGWNWFAFRQHTDELEKDFNKFYIVLETFEVFLELS